MRSLNQNLMQFYENLEIGYPIDISNKSFSSKKSEPKNDFSDAI